MNIIILRAKGGRPQNLNYLPFKTIYKTYTNETWFYSKNNIFFNESNLINKIRNLKIKSIFIIVNISLPKHVYKLINNNHFTIFFETQPPMGLFKNARPLSKFSLDYLKASLKKTFSYKIVEYLSLLKKLGLKKGDILLSLSNEKRYFFIKHVCIHTIKYNEWIEKNNASTLYIKKSYVVFIDSNITNHPDYNDFKIPGKQINKIKYFRLLNDYFDYFEYKYQTEIIIAPHPCAQYKSNEFKGRTISSLGTPELIKDAKLVIAHNSTSILTAVLAEKKIIILYYSELLKAKSKPWFQRAVYFSITLNTELVNIENNGYKELDWTIDKNAYEIFKNRYICCKNIITFSSEEIINGVVSQIINNHDKN